MRTLLVAVLVLLIPLSYGDQSDEKNIAKRKTSDIFSVSVDKTPSIRCRTDDNFTINEREMCSNISDYLSYFGTADCDDAKKMADQGDSESQYIVGVLYNNGKTVPQDYKEAFKWFKLSAEQGNKQAIYMVWRMYEEGRGVLKDPVEAKNWLKKCCGCEEGIWKHCF